MLVSGSEVADVRSRYLVPTSCHPAHAVSGAINLASSVDTGNRRLRVSATTAALLAVSGSSIPVA